MSAIFSAVIYGVDNRLGDGAILDLSNPLATVIFPWGSPITGLTASSSVLSVSAPVAGVVTLGLANQAAGTILAGPVSGAAGPPTFKTLAQLGIGGSYSLPANLAAIAALPNADGWLHNNGGGGFAWSTASQILDYVGLVQGSLLYRDAAAWSTLIPGTIGTALLSGGAGANPAYGVNDLRVVGSPTFAGLTLSGLGLGVAHVSAGGVLSSSAVALTDMATQANNTILGNVSGGAATPSALTITQVLDIAGNTRGSLLYRGTAAWDIRIPSATVGAPLLSAGAGADPNYGTAIVANSLTSEAGQNLTLAVGTAASGVVNIGGTLVGTSPTAAAILGKSLGLTENLWLGGHLSQQPGTLAGLGNYLNANATNAISTTLLIPGVLFYNSGATVYGVDLGNAGGNYRLRFLSGGRTFSWAYTATNPPTDQSHFIEDAILSGGALTLGASIATAAPAAHASKAWKLGEYGSGLAYVDIDTTVYSLVTTGYAIPLSQFATIANNTVLGNISGGAAVPSAIAAGQFPGTSTNDDAAAGKVGEFVYAQLVVGSAVNVPNGVGTNITSISLTAGDWMVGGDIFFLPAVGTVVSAIYGGISSTSGTIGGYDGQFFYVQSFPAGAAFANISAVLPIGRISVAATTTFYLIAYVAITTSTMGCAGQMWARRMR
jgi:hypothetical protein